VALANLKLAQANVERLTAMTGQNAVLVPHSVTQQAGQHVLNDLNIAQKQVLIDTRKVNNAIGALFVSFWGSLNSLVAFLSPK
jgi:hypothetical protein